MNTVTLWCQAGQHHWERQSQRGRKPFHCPEHAPKPAPPTGKRGRIEAMAAGRERALATKRREAVIRVKAYRDWLSKDAPLFGALERGELSRAEYQQRRPAVPIIPSDSDYALAREEGAIQ